jgi:hypothetical protein
MPRCRDAAVDSGEHARTTDSDRRESWRSA